MLSRRTRSGADVAVKATLIALWAGALIVFAWRLLPDTEPGEAMSPCGMYVVPQGASTTGMEADDDGE